jgi:antitoxin ChpS
MAIVALRALGGSVVMSLPRQILSILHLGVGSQVEINVEAGRLIVEPKITPKYILSDLLAKCTEENMALTTDDQEWLNFKPVGKEVPL